MPLVRLLQVWVHYCVLEEPSNVCLALLESHSVQQ